MLTDDKNICTPEFWETVYNGERNNAKTDASNFKRPANAFDRFKWLADQVEGPRVLDIASGHATTMKRLRAMHPWWTIYCSDQTEAAKKAANWEGEYIIESAYNISQRFDCSDLKPFDSVTVSQAIEYMEHPDVMMENAKRLAHYFICTIPDGSMDKWSQLKLWDELSLKAWLSFYGDLIHFDKVPGLMLAKIKFK